LDKTGGLVTGGEEGLLLQEANKNINKGRYTIFLNIQLPDLFRFIYYLETIHED
jgi:hypothetical protein